ncbi:beta-galactosidase [Paenibacillus pasadenensis]|uniref:Beta-galactosidase n=1 Tax=Paenibacillus pasadenensis TaxID=217090 RepID=A0A2N5N262_9BACL|nr:MULTISPECIES: beta-galactosidase [Paenibacillus]PLT44415.1 Beta-galactosidase [Paenibacillus pasadenensis]QGG54899.1 beta-galactosidase [Paenibacillus sp. B01]
MISNKLPKIWYGGDYNPEQWDAETWSEDHRMFKLAGIDVATINVFSWALDQPDEDTYDFAWLDEQFELLHGQGIGICLATGTGAHPAWMARRHPDVLRVDFDGRKRRFGGRHNSCPNSPAYRKFSAALATKLAERYGSHPALLIWHVSNEYGGYCYCDNCAAGFRSWLQQRYGSLEELNRSWNTRFWGHTFYDWEEVVPPNALSEEWGGSRTNFQGISLDYRRFQSDSLLDCFKLERDAVKALTPDIPVTTNLMGFYPELDYFKWAKEMDVVSWDNYPSIDTPHSLTAMAHDLMRGLKDGQPFMLMEQTPSQQNWQAYNSLKRPGVMRLWSWQAVAHGADTVMFFQLRRSIGACEKYHGAVIEHVGHEHTRVFREVAELGGELQAVGGELLDARGDAAVGIVFDWENRWAIDLSSGPTVALDYVKEAHKYYDALAKQQVAADMIGVDADFSRYRVVIAPVMYMVKPGFAAAVERFVEAGGTFITTFFSGIVDERDIVRTGGYPGELRQVLGIWSEEIDALLPEQRNRIVLSSAWSGGAEDAAAEAQRQTAAGSEHAGTAAAGTSARIAGGASGLAEYECGLLCDLIHSEGAEVKAVYGDDFYAGMPALTVNRFGAGRAWYVATSPDEAFLGDFLREVCAENGIEPLVAEASAELETAARVKDGQRYLFLLNHAAEEGWAELSSGGDDLLGGGASVAAGRVSVPARGVRIIRQRA